MKKHFISATKNSLFEIISTLNKDPSLFVRNPRKHFTRKRKLDFATFMKFTLGWSGRSMNKEMLGFFDFSTKAPSNSAYNQQRSKVLPEAFKFLFHEFTSKLKLNRRFHGYRLIACDGSNISIASNPKDTETRVRSNHSATFLSYLEKNGLHDIAHMEAAHIFGYISTLQKYSSVTIKHTLGAVRLFPLPAGKKRREIKILQGRL